MCITWPNLFDMFAQAAVIMCNSFILLFGLHTTKCAGIPVSQLKVFLKRKTMLDPLHQLFLKWDQTESLTWQNPQLFLRCRIIFSNPTMRLPHPLGGVGGERDNDQNRWALHVEHSGLILLRIEAHTWPMPGKAPVKLDYSKLHLSSLVIKAETEKAGVIRRLYLRNTWKMWYFCNTINLIS